MMARATVLSACFGLLLVTALTGCEVRRDSASEASPTPEQASLPTVSVPPAPAATTGPAAPLPPEPANQAPPPLAGLISFPNGGTQLDTQAQAVLRRIMASRQVGQGWPIMLRGHSDSGGSDGANLITSRQRAEEVAGWLVDRGIAQERVEIIAFGEHRALAPNAHLDGRPSESGRARNRRVEIWIGPPGSAPDEDTQWDDWPTSAANG